MKRVFTILAAVIITAGVFAQAPQKMSYQAIVRDAAGELIKSTQVGIEINILQGSATGTGVYTETQTPTTNANGLLTIEIGGGTGFDAIDWANGPYYLETKIDPTGGTNYTITGTSQLLSVPYALHSKTAETAASSDLLNERIKNIQSSMAGGKVTDVDGNVYNTVKIGNQIWMAENLKVEHYADGTAIPFVTDTNGDGSTDDEWAALGDNNTDKAMCYYYNNAGGEKDTYVDLYTYATAVNGTPYGGTNNVQGVCPDGWHLPSDAEWTELENYISNDGHGGTEGAALKTTSGWYQEGNGTDIYGFSALPGGCRHAYNGTFYNVGSSGFWWSATEYDSSYAYYRSLYYLNSDVDRYLYHKSFGLSVRCTRD